VEPARRPRLALLRLLPCDGCEQAVRECEAEIRAVADLEPARSTGLHAAHAKLWDLALVSGAITAPHDAASVRALRRRARVVATLGACATASGLEALRACAEARERRAAPWPPAGSVAGLATAAPIAQHVRVDHELRGCPIAKPQLLELVGAVCQRRRPSLTSHSVCVECKRRGLVCVLVARGAACLGPVTQAGCDARCPAEGRGCEACFGPMESPQGGALDAILRGLNAGQTARPSGTPATVVGWHAPRLRPLS
jgi:sulfhydrogenase subunit delta